MATDPTAFVAGYIARMEGAEPDLDRVVREPAGLDAAGMMEALSSPALREPGRQPIGLQMLCDWMAPEGSIYFDAIYGDFRGQRAIRNWLVPTMATIEFIEFVPTAEGVLIDDGEGGTSVDEWQMFVNLGELQMPLSRGVSVRRYRGGWATWSCDVYDTGPFRVEPPPDLEIDTEIEAEPIPDWPRTVWEPTGEDIDVASGDPDELAERFHPTDSVYHDPRAGELRGRDAIRDFLRASIAGSEGTVLEALGPRLSDGVTSVREWQQVAVGADGSRSFMTRGTSVRRRTDGMISYAADYYDTASLVTRDPSA